ncbi:histidine phosphatase family protein [Marinospirillum sp.]|uniref:histidine phosphatase family protein n=1 Tax=Marinospirillum sp. TaxID=2183934 RepID=UPI003A8A2BA7
MSSWIWRHPRPEGVLGRCIGQTDVPVDPRRLKRLADRLERHARQHQLARQVYVSPLQRSQGVGAWLAQQGWEVIVVPELMEMHFGEWEGRAWSSIALAEIDAWCADFFHYAPGGGENLAQVFERVECWLRSQREPWLMVGHAGWINAAHWITERPSERPQATTWPLSVKYGKKVALRCVF